MEQSSKANIKKSIVIKLKVEGIHNWPGCDIEEVSYLMYPHRHTFGIECQIGVEHGDRAVEFIEFKHKIASYIHSRWYQMGYGCNYFGPMSCEHIATELLEEFNLDKCSVSEDDEFWGVVERV